MSAALRVGAVVLAAGRSTRMAPAHKLLQVIGSRTLVAHAVDAVLLSGVATAPVRVVLADPAGPIAAALGARPVAVVPAPEAARGLSASLAAGIASLGPDHDAILVALGDMPLVRPGTIRALAARFAAARSASRPPIVVPVHDGRQGHPVLWDARYAAALGALTGDAGGRTLIRDGAASGALVRMPTEDGGVLVDVDDQAALEQVCRLVVA